MSKYISLNNKKQVQVGLAGIVKKSTTLFVPKQLANNNSHFTVTASDATTEKLLRDCKKITVKAGQTVIVKPLEIHSTTNPELVAHHPTLVVVTTYKSDGQIRADMPEGSDGIIIDQVGIMPMSEIEPAHEYQKVSQEPIFPLFDDLKAEHIFQSTIGDCYLLAALIAILKTQTDNKIADGKNIILQMIRQEGRYTFVKLHNPITLEVHELKVLTTQLCVNKSAHLNPQELTDHLSTVNHMFNWTHMIENAYAAFGWDSSKTITEQNLNSASYLSIYANGGTPSVALKILTGTNAFDKKVKQQTILSPWTSTGITFAITYYKKNENNNDSDADEYFNQFIQDNPIFANTDKSVWLAWGKYINEIEGSANNVIRKQWDALLKSIEDKIYLDEIITAFQQLEQFTPKIPDPIIEAFKKWTYSTVSFAPGTEYESIESPFVGPLGSGLYTKHQLELYKSIHKQLQQHQFLVASTGNINNVAGLRGPHAYAVAGVETRIIKGKKVKFVRLINPWGNTGRIYDWENQAFWVARKKEFISEDENKGEFILELSEFTQYIATLTTGQNPLISRPQLAAQVQQSMEPVIQKSSEQTKPKSDAAVLNKQATITDDQPECDSKTTHLAVTAAPQFFDGAPQRRSATIQKAELSFNASSAIKGKQVTSTHTDTEHSVILNKATKIKKDLIESGLSFFSYHQRHNKVSFSHSRQKTAQWINDTAKKLSPDNAMRFLYACHDFTYSNHSDLTNDIKKSLQKINGEVPEKISDQELIKRLNIHDFHVTLLKKLFAYIASAEKSVAYKLSYLYNEYAPEYIQLSTDNINANCDYARSLIVKILDGDNRHKDITTLLQEFNIEMKNNKPKSIDSGLQKIIDGHNSAFNRVYLVN